MEAGRRSEGGSSVVSRMVEYIKRYDEFAEFLCSHGYYVVGNDHLGHGKSVQSKSEYGFFNESMQMHV